MSIDRLLNICSTIAKITLLFFALYRVVLCFSSKLEISVGESNNVWNVLKTADDHKLYTNPEDLPFEVFQYTPLSQYPVVLLAKILNENSARYLLNLISLGRLFSLLYCLLAVWALYQLITVHLKIKSSIAWISIVVIFSILTQHSYSIRPDALAFLFTALSILSFIVYSEKETIVNLVFASIWPVLAFYTKQDSVFIIVPCGIWLVLNNRWIAAIKWGILFTVFFSLMGLLFFNFYSQTFVNSVTKGISTGYDLMQAYWVFDRVTAIYGLLLSIVVIFIIASVLHFKKNTLYFLISICSIMFFLLAVVTTMKKGSWVNYYLLFLVFGILCLASFVQVLTSIQSGTSSYIVFPLIVMLTFVIPIDQLVKRTLVYFTPFLKFTESYNEYEKARSVATYTTDSIPEGFLYTSDNYLKNILHRRSVFPNTEFYGVSKFNYSKYYSSSPYMKGIQVIILPKFESISSDQTLKVFGIDHNHFYIHSQKSGYNIYKLKNEYYR